MHIETKNSLIENTIVVKKLNNIIALDQKISNLIGFLCDWKISSAVEQYQEKAKKNE
jgi:hypothetical protein